jgi:hypothetical protein
MSFFFQNHWHAEVPITIKSDLLFFACKKSIILMPSLIYVNRNRKIWVLFTMEFFIVVNCPLIFMGYNIFLAHSMKADKTLE